MASSVRPTNEGPIERDADESSYKEIQRKYWLRPLLFLIGVVGLSIGVSRLPLGFQLRGSKGRQGKGSGSTSTPAESEKSSLEYQTISQLYKNPGILLDKSTPQGRAFEMLASEGLADDFRILQRYVLMVLYYSTNGAGWSFDSASNTFSLNEFGTFSKGWHLFSPNECSWQGIDCSKQRGGYEAVTTIRLGGSNLDGIVPSEICLLSKLQRFVVPDNRLHGEIPECLPILENLMEINMNNNLLSGGLTSNLLSAPSLEILSLSHNQFHDNLSDMLDGILDDQNEELEKLKQLNLDNNMFSGVVPPRLSTFQNLKELSLHGNNLTGTIELPCGIERLTADCSEVACTCCTECF